MRILFLLQDLPYPPTDGVRWKPYNVIQHMSREHECHVVAFQEPGSGRDQAWMEHNPRVKVLATHRTASGARLLVGRVGALLSGRPLSVARWASPSLRAQVRRLAAEGAYDVVHVDMLNLAQYLPDLAGAPTVCSINDASSRLHPQLLRLEGNPWRRLLYRVLGARLRRYERTALMGAHRVHVVSPRDAEYLRRLAPGLRVEAISIAVADQFFQVAPAEDSRAPTLLSLGLINSSVTAAPFLEFVRDVWPRVREGSPDASFVVLARGAQDALGRRVGGVPGLRVLDWVDDYEGTLAEAHVVLCLDAAGTGIKNRVVQAMAAGRAVVGTRAAFEGIPVEHGVSGFVCDSVAEAGTWAGVLLRDAALRAAVGRGAREVAAAHFASAVVGRRWEALYREVAGEGWRPVAEAPPRHLVLKGAAAAVLGHPLMGRALDLAFRGVIPARGMRFRTSGAVAPSSKAQLFWGMYESAEDRFVTRHLRRDLDVVEVGSGMGVVSSRIGRLLDPGRRLVCVEANADLLPLLRENVARNAPECRVEFVHAALGGTDGQAATFVPGATHETSTIRSPTEAASPGGRPVPTVTLAGLLEARGLGAYTLVCDVEGAEAAFILAPGSLERCAQLVIELHDTEHDGRRWTVDDLAGAVVARQGMAVVDCYGPVFVFQRGAVAG